MSHFSNAWGMACDHVQSFEVVTPDCEMVTASASTNPDLFRALKGSGSNSGIITNLTLYTNPEYQIWYTFRIYAASDAAAVMAAAIAVQHEMTQDDKLGFFLMVKPTCFVAGLLYRGHTTTITSGFAAIDSLTPIAVPVPPTNGTQLSCAQACAMSNKAKRKSGTATVRPDAELDLALQSLLVDMVTKHDVKFALQFTFQPVDGASVNTISAASGGNVMGIRDEEQAWLAIMAEWEDERDDEKADVVIRELIDGIHEEVRRMEGLVEWWFMNDAALGQDVLGGYAEEEGKFMRDVKGRWDEEGVMGRLQNGGFLVERCWSDKMD